MKTSILSLLVFLFSLNASAKTKIYWWHAMSGSLNDTVDQMVANYNKSQDKYEVVASLKGNYTETLNAAIAAYRGKKQPHVVQVFEVGTMTMMNSGAIYPVQKLMDDMKVEMNWNQFLQPVLSYYRQDGKLMSMPFNSSTPILYYNKEMLKKAGVKKVPSTWEELHAANKAVVASGGDCGLVSGWQSWVLIENFSAIHDQPMASLGNGFEGFSKDLQFNNELVINNIKRLQTGIKDKTFSYEGRGSDPARTAFVNKKCAFWMDSSGSISAAKKTAKFDWGVSQLPYYQSVKPKNSIIGGATNWVFKGHKKDEYAAVADFLKFIGSTDNQTWWHQETGYLPISKLAYEKLKKEGYYQKEPEQEVAVLQMLRSEPTRFSAGIRLGGFTQIREVINEELEKIWSGQETADAGINRAVKRGNQVLKKFARTASRKKTK